MDNEIIGTYSKCCKIFREGKVEIATVHTANCFYNRQAKNIDKETLYLGVLDSVKEKFDG